MKQHQCIPYQEGLLKFARENRKNMTKPELIFWQQVRKKKLKYKCLRQKMLRSFIVDFYFPELLLGVEIDGNSHDEKKEYDEHRSQILERDNIQIIRFNNDQIIYKLPKCLKKLRQIIAEREKALPFGEGLGWGCIKSNPK